MATGKSNISQVGMWQQQHNTRLPGQGGLRRPTTSFENFINKEDPSQECYPSKVAANPLENTENEMVQATGPDDDCENGSGDEDESDPDTEETADMGNADEEIRVSFDGSGKLVPMGNQLADSQKRDDELNHVCVWDFIIRVDRVSKSSDRRKHRSTAENHDKEDMEAMNLFDDDATDHDTKNECDREEIMI
ncbi:hypothetical protein B0H13DRAFT_1881107 [Mycena leptocephala]|nr:hypothetical protein B0H13DRAFT_1881107 [Mycena leptocephala]